MGAALSWAREVVPPKSKFSVNNIPDLAGKVIIVTGAKTGIGKETTLMSETIRELKDKTGNEAIFLKLDQVAAEEFLSKETQLHVLINNAGVMFPPKDLLTADGYDLQFGTNVLGHHYFTKLLLPTLISTAQTSPDGKARVVTVASSAHLFGSLDFATFKDGPVRKKMSPQSLYGQSK
ncbi:hypothetical protein SERLA73DRAFT_95927, partial [Serpula lacrymans var. lacrymans S7.3]